MQIDTDSVRRAFLAPRQHSLIARGEGVTDKLQQWPEQGRRHLRSDTRAPAAWHREVGRKVSRRLPDEWELACLQRLASLEIRSAGPADGAELLVRAGNKFVDA